MSNPLTYGPKSNARIEAGLALLRQHLEIPPGSIHQFDDEDESYWEADPRPVEPRAARSASDADFAKTHLEELGKSLFFADGAPTDVFHDLITSLNNASMFVDEEPYLGEPRFVPRIQPSQSSLLHQVSQLASVTGLWPICRTEWDGVYPADWSEYSHPDFPLLTPLQRVVDGIEYRNATSSRYPLPGIHRLASARSERSVQPFPDLEFSLVQADSLVDLLRYGVCELFNNDSTFGHWQSLVERFELQVIDAEWHYLGLYQHRLPASIEDAELLQLEIASTGVDTYPSVDVLLEGGYFNLELS